MKSADFYAQQILLYAAQVGVKVTHLKLQKALFFMQYFNLMRTGKELFNDQFCAFKYGPVVYEVFARFAGNGNLPLKPSQNLNLMLTSEQQQDLDLLFAKSAWELVDISHKRGGAWDKVYHADALADIPAELVREDAKKKLYNEFCR